MRLRDKMALKDQLIMSLTRQLQLTTVELQRASNASVLSTTSNSLMFANSYNDTTSNDVIPGTTETSPSPTTTTHGHNTQNHVDHHHHHVHEDNHIEHDDQNHSLRDDKISIDQLTKESAQLTRKATQAVADSQPHPHFHQISSSMSPLKSPPSKSDQAFNDDYQFYDSTPLFGPCPECLGPQLSI